MSIKTRYVSQVKTGRLRLRLVDSHDP